MLSRNHLRLAGSDTIRDRAFEARFLSEVLRSCRERYNLGTDLFVRDVRERTEDGQRRFGDRFLTYDAPREIREEGQDASIYALLDVQIREEGQDLLYEIAVHACAIDALTRKIDLLERGVA